MRLILVRHGETDRNNDHTLVGEGKAYPLNEAGRSQAQAVANRLASEKIDIIYSSDLPRARQTAVFIAARYPHIDILYTKDIRERDSGEFSTHSVADKEAAQRASGINFRDWQPPGGESIRDLKHRAGRWFEQCRKNHAEQTVLVVSHGLFMYSLLEWAVEGEAEVEKEKYSLHNTSVTTLDVPPEGVAKIIHLNDTTHLQDSKKR